nr:hypothetical protein [Jannaschia sp. Os4]
MPPYHFRVKENGAQVFRVDAENRQRRLELDQIATVNVNNGNVKPQGDTQLSDADRAAIDAWLAERRDVLARRADSTGEAALEAISLAAQWAQAQADDDQLDAVTDRLLLAMHDLRTVLVRKRADRVLGDREG